MQKRSMIAVLKRVYDNQVRFCLHTLSTFLLLDGEFFARVLSANAGTRHNVRTNDARPHTHNDV